MATTTFSNLSDELFLHIVSFLNPPALLSFALTHRRALNCSQHILTQHQEWDSQFRIIHDRAPLFIPTLLQRGLEDPQGELWHLRRFESWGTRVDWSEWDTFDVNRNDEDLGEDGGPVESDDHTEMTGEYYDGEYGEAMKAVMRDRLCFTEEETQQWMQSIRGGSDEALKGLMIALAPKIKTVIFIAHPFDAYPLRFLSKAISHIVASSPTPVWPPGFQSLTSISIADYTRLQHPHDNFYCPVSAVIPFFRLPNLKELSLQVVGYHDDEEESDLPAGSSSVEWLKMDCCEISHTVIDKMVLACRALKSIELDSSWTNRFKEFISTYPGRDSLERIQGVSVKQWLLGYVQPSSEQVISVREDLMLRIDNGAGREDAFELEVCQRPGFTDSQESSAWFVVQNLKEVVSPTVKTISFGLTNNRTPFPTPKVKLSLRHQPYIARLLLQSILELVEDLEYSNLKEICLFRLVGVPVQIDEWSDDDASFSWDEDLYQKIVAKGVDLHRPSRDGALTRVQEQEEIRAHHKKHQSPDVERLKFVHMTDPRIGHPRHAGRIFPEVITFY